MTFLDLPFVKGIPLKILIVGILLAMCLLSNVVSAEIAYQSYNISQSDRKPNISIPMPSGVAQNDLLLAQITYNVGNVVNTTGPSDWTLVIRTNNGPMPWDGQYVGQAIYYKVANASESGPYVWNISWGPVTGYSQTAIGGIMRFSGVDPATPIFGYSGGIGNSNNLTAPGINNVPENSMLVACFGLDGSTSSFAVPSNMTWIYRDVFKRFGTPVVPSFAAAWELYGPGGTTGVRYSSNSFSAAPWVAQLVALQPASGSCTAPSITTQPKNITACGGSPVSFSVSATGTVPLSYQWQKNGGDIAGATKSNLEINPVAVIDEGDYTVNVSNNCGYVVSSPATLTVNIPPSITTQPTNVTACVGSPVTFSVCATGSGTLYYQWYHGSTAVGTNSNTLTISPVGLGDAGGYWVVVSSSTGCTAATSNTVGLTVNTPPSIGTQPQSQTKVYGESVTFSVIATGTTPLTYQWKKGGSDISGARSDNYTIPSVTMSDEGSYTVNVSNGCGSRTSNAAILTVNKANTTTTVTSSKNPSVYSQLAPTFTGKVIAVPPGGGTPTGTVTFKDGITTLGTSTLSGGMTTFTPSTTALSVGTHSITVVYPGDANFIGSTSSVFTQIVNPPPKITAYVPNNGKRGAAAFKFVISGSAFQNGATVSLAKTGVPTIVATGVSVSASKNSITCTLKIPSSAPTGVRSVTVKNPDGGTVTVSGFTVK